MIKDYKYVIIGSGFFGSVIAERIANDMNEKVIIIDKNNHIGGKCYSEIDSKTGIEYHKYGTHIFHTSNQKVWDYINRFTKFNGYYHQVLTTFNEKVYQMPINLETINSFFDINLKPYEVEEFIREKRTNFSEPSNFEEAATNSIGYELYDAFIKGYTQKQWQTDPKELPASIIKRLPVRSNYHESYFYDINQGIPLMGYTAVFNNMLNNKRIKVLLSTTYNDIKNEISDDAFVVYTGAIDEFFDYKLGRLDWLSLKFESEYKNLVDYQGTSVMNYANVEVPYTRIHEYKHLHPERETYTSDMTLITREYSLHNPKDPIYPISNKRSKDIYSLYDEEAKKMKNFIFGGRLGEYKYYDMHITIEKALDTYEKIIKK